MTAADRWKAITPHDRDVLVRKLRRAIEDGDPAECECGGEGCEGQFKITIEADPYVARAALELLEDA